MASVTYKHQPAIGRTHGRVRIEGTQHPYEVTALLWPQMVAEWISARCIGATLHACCGHSRIGTCRVDRFQEQVDVCADAAHLPFAAQSWDTVLIDPPYNGIFQWNHDMLSELGRVARQRIIFQHWFVPVDGHSRFKKAHRFTLTELAVWQPQTYFGRAQLITVLDCIQERLF